MNPEVLAGTRLEKLISLSGWLDWLDLLTTPLLAAGETLTAASVNSALIHLCCEYVVTLITLCDDVFVSGTKEETFMEDGQTERIALEYKEYSQLKC